jgi:small subunit ribosomal protein S16
MVKIRLTRLGRHKSPFYRLVAIDSKTKRDGGYLQLLGTYNPQRNEINLKDDLILNYLRNGAQPSDTALALLKDKGI